MILRVINILLASVMLIAVGYRMILDGDFEPFPNFYLYLMTLVFLLFGIETLKEGQKVYGCLLMVCFAMNVVSVIQHLASVI